MDELKHKEQKIEELKKENNVLKKELMNKYLNGMTSFLGKPISFWIELNKQITELNLERVITINATYRFLLTQIVKSRSKNIGLQLEDYWKIQKYLNKAKRAEELEEQWQNQKEN